LVLSNFIRGEKNFQHVASPAPVAILSQQQQQRQRYREAVEEIEAETAAETIAVQEEDWRTTIATNAADDTQRRAGEERTALSQVPRRA
jgi:RNase H-fold protein (predicted Holliday junction resolvase)